MRWRTRRELWTDAVAALLAGVILTLGYWAWEPLPVDRMIEAPTAVNVPRPGGDLSVRWHYEVLRRCPNHFERRIENGGKRWVLGIHHGGNAMPGVQRYVSSVRLPTDIEPGRYRYVVTGFFACNPLFPIRRDYPPIEFEVTD